MADLVIVTVIIAFTALCVAYISWCDRIIGPEELPVDSAVPTAPAAVVAPGAEHAGVAS